MPTEIETQIHKYFEWVERRSGHNLRPPVADPSDGDLSMATLSSVDIESLSDFGGVDGPDRGQGRNRYRNTVLIGAAATLAVVIGLVAIGSDRTGSPTIPATQPTQPLPSEVVPLPDWEGSVAIKVSVDPGASDAQLTEVEAVLRESTDTVAEWIYLDADASLLEAERVLADDPDTLDLLDVDNIPTVFDVVVTSTADDASLEQLLQRLRELPGVLDAVTSAQAEQRTTPSSVPIPVVSETDTTEQVDPPLSVSSAPMSSSEPSMPAGQTVLPDDLSLLLPDLPDDLENEDLSLTMSNGITLVLEPSTGSAAESDTDVCVVLYRTNELSRVCSARRFVGGLIFFGFDDPELRKTSIYALTTADVQVDGDDSCIEVETTESGSGAVRLTGCTVADGEDSGALVFRVDGQSYTAEMFLPDDRFGPNDS